MGERSEPHQGQGWLPRGEPLGCAERAQRGAGVPHRVAVAQSRVGITSSGGVPRGETASAQELRERSSLDSQATRRCEGAESPCAVAISQGVIEGNVIDFSTVFSTIQ